VPSRQGRRRDGDVDQLVSMIDIFTILIIYMLVNTAAVQVIAPSRSTCRNRSPRKRRARTCGDPSPARRFSSDGRRS